MLSDELKELKRRERHRTNAETRYWCDQYRLFAERAVAEAAVKDAMGGEPVAVVDASDDGWFASILPDTSVKLGQLLYTRPQASAAVPDDVAKDAERYRWLKSRMVGVNFDWDDEGMTALAFEMPDNLSFCADCDKNIDSAMLAASKQEVKNDE